MKNMKIKTQKCTNLQVAMDHVLRVNVLNAVEDLLKMMAFQGDVNVVQEVTGGQAATDARIPLVQVLAQIHSAQLHLNVQVGTKRSVNLH